MNAIEVVHNYDLVITKLMEDIKKSDFKVAYFLKLLNLKSSFFYKKMREKRFTNEEVKLLSKHLYPEQYQAYKDVLISALLEKSEAELSAGLGVDFEGVLKESKLKYGGVL
jgi:hypothetical protein